MRKQNAEEKYEAFGIRRGL